MKREENIWKYLLFGMLFLGIILIFLPPVGKYDRDVTKKVSPQERDVFLSVVENERFGVIGSSVPDPVFDSLCEQVILESPASAEEMNGQFQKKLKKWFYSKKAQKYLPTAKESDSIHRVWADSGMVAHRFGIKNLVNEKYK